MFLASDDASYISGQVLHPNGGQVVDRNRKEDSVGQKPRQAPQNVPDSLPKRDEGTDVAPDDVRRTDRSRSVPPDLLPGPMTRGKPAP